ncbi:MAG: cell wall-binding repeat-containing protein [Corynebacterium sp.]|nr:cell wall-binding repeat-containing protein [Corynebacterium sp.]
MKHTSLKTPSRRWLPAVAVPGVIALSLGLASCSSSDSDDAGLLQTDKSAATFEETTIISDATGIELSEKLFGSSDDVVIASAALQDQWEGAQEAVRLGAPLLVLDSATEDAADRIDAEVERLGAENVHRFEDNAADAGKPADAEAINTELATPDAAISPEVAADIAATEEAALADAGAEMQANLEVHDATVLTTATPQGLVITHVADLEAEDKYEEQAPVLVNGSTSVAEAATARAKGLELSVLQSSDPRESVEVMEDPSQNLLVLGKSFADEDDFNTRLELAENGEINGGGGTVFPGRRMIALYGHPSGPALGALGEQPLEEAVTRVTEMVADYQQYTSEPVIPAFEIIATVAASEPGPGGNYTNYTDPAELQPWIDAITAAGGYAVIDLQPGRATFLEQAKYYEDLLKNPNVGLALDPEWRIGPDELPLQRIGSVTAAEINETADWLAELVRENDLPQKALVLHQFKMGMIENRSELKTDIPELSFVLHADGHGTPDLKFGTWGVLQQDMPANIFMAWKNFYDEDDPTFTPEQTYAVDPRPWFVSYQ